MSKALKGMMREELKSRFENVDGGVFISTQGLDSEKTYDFRRTLHAWNIKYTVIRNAFLSHAFGTYGYSQKQLEGVLQGPIGVVYTHEEGSATAAAKAIAEWKRTSKDRIIQWRGAFLEGQIVGPDDAQKLKDAPTKEQARAMLLGVFQAPITRLLATLREPYARVVYVLNALKEKREGGES